MDRLSVSQAAEVLGVTQAALYKRIQRGTVAHDKDSEGHVFIYLDASDIPPDKSMDEPDMSTDGSMDRSNGAELIAELRTHNEHLRQEVEAWREEARRKDAILMTMAQRIPELEAAQEPRDGPLRASEEADKGTAPSEQQEPTQHRSWWRAFFGLE
jgi:hypothetical protein